MATEANNEADKLELSALFLILKQIASEHNVDLRQVEIKGTIYFFPLLPAKE